MMTSKLPPMTLRCLLAGAAISGLCCVFTACLTGLGARAQTAGAPAGLNLSAPGVAWAGFVAPREPNYTIARLFNDYANPATGLGPVSDGPAHPYVNNEVAREMRTEPTYRVADLDNAAAKNLMPWVREALAKQNELVLRGRNGETREARCWETGVPAFHLNPGLMHIIQTPKEVVLFLTGRARHIWLDVPHSANPKPSWYGESVGHYEGDELVVDTIGLSDRTFVDNYRTPHTDQMHVVERFKMVDDGKTLQVSVTVDDPGAFNMPWSAMQRWRRIENTPLIEDLCEPNNDFFFGYWSGAALPHADKPDF
jgi:hypothetical protein